MVKAIILPGENPDVNPCLMAHNPIIFHGQENMAWFCFMGLIMVKSHHFHVEPTQFYIYSQISFQFLSMEGPFHLSHHAIPGQPPNHHHIYIVANSPIIFHGNKIRFNPPNPVSWVHQIQSYGEIPMFKMVLNQSIMIQS